MDNSTTVHDYYPLWIQLPHFVANDTSPISLIVRFGIQWLAVVGASYFLIGRLRPTVGLSDRIAFTWMCLSIFRPVSPPSIIQVAKKRAY